MNIVEFLSTVHKIILNDSQQLGVLSVEQNTLLLAVPGSGKTTVLVSRIANLLINHGVRSDTMLTLTYSKETSRDMTARYNQLFQTLGSMSPEFRTIHSFCLMVMKYYAHIKGRIMPKLISNSASTQAKVQLLRHLYKKHNQEYLNDDLLETLNQQMCFVKNMMLTPKEIEEDFTDLDSFGQIYADYEQYKKKNKLMDFDDMLTYAYDIFIKQPTILKAFQKKYRYINVDEAQDTSLVQHKIIELLSANSTIFMVGDEDQSIYSFRGAYPKALLDFKENYKEAAIIKMEQNFRSNSDIVSVANRFIKQNKQRYPKEMYCTNTNTNSIEIVKLKDFSEQYEYILNYVSKNPAKKSIGIIYRNNESAIPLIDLFYKRNLQFYIKDHTQSYFTSFVLRDIVSYFRLSTNPCDIESFQQVYYKLGIARNVFELVQSNIHDFDDVFSCTIALSNPSTYRIEQLKFYKSALKRLANMRPDKAIANIMDSLGYQNFIENRLGEGFSKTNAYQKINTAICLAKGVETIPNYLDKLSELYLSFGEGKNVSSTSQINLSTLHSCKGFEYDIVFLLDIIKDVIPSSDAVSDMLEGDFEPIENETRLFYVGLTRAKTKLVLFRSRMLNGAITLPSRFIGIVEKEGLEGQN